MTIAAYADWLGGSPNAPTLLPSLLQLLTSALSAPEDACAAAALALKHVCDGQFLVFPNRSIHFFCFLRGLIDIAAAGTLH